MNAISKVSEITAQDLAEYIRIPDPDSSDIQLLNNLLGVSVSFIEDYTGVSDLDAYQNFVIAVFVLVQDLWDTRTLYVDKANLNKVVEAILNMHSRNYL